MDPMNMIKSTAIKLTVLSYQQCFGSGLKFGFNQVGGSVSGFGPWIWIRIQEGKNDPQT
jgi:hypothetical protein